MGRFLLLVLPLLLVSCTAYTGARSAPATVVPTTPGVPRPGTGVGPYRSGDCLETPPGDGTLTKVSCDRPHQFEVTTSANFTPDVPAAYPPDVKHLASPACRTAFPAYVGSPDADASTLETRAYWPGEREWNEGARWYACLVMVRGGDNIAAEHPGRLAAVLAHGLGRFQECREGVPLEESPIHVVPCSGPHRSEAVPGVLPIDPSTDPQHFPAREAIDHCTAKVAAYLGGSRPGVSPHAVAPLPEDWPAGDRNILCWAVSDHPVTGLMGHA